MGKSTSGERVGPARDGAGGPDAAASAAIRAGERALDAADWPRAAELFREALGQGDPGPARAWEGLGWAAWWLADEEQTFEARLEAFRLYREAGDSAGAAVTAAWIAADYREFKGEQAKARGWIQRAGRLLEGQPEDPAHGWVALLQADLALNFDRDSVGALILCEQAARIGREFGISDLEAVGLAQGGCCHVAEGRIDEGMRQLDEAITIATSEDLHLPITEGWALCCLISTCDGIGDFQRAAEWCENTRRFAQRWGARQLIGLCRSSYGRVLATQGDWPAAEAELTGAVEDLRSTRPGMAAGGLARLGELRARQGRDGEARELFEQAGAAGQVGLGELELDGGSPAQAVAMAERALRAIPEQAILDRLPAQELLVRALAASGKTEEAAVALEAVSAAAKTVGTPYLRARASLVGAEYALAAGDAETARRQAEDAVDAFTDSATPYDVARARFALARSLAALGWPDQAESERAAARRVFDELGAARDARLASGPLPRPSASGDPRAASPGPELEVLTSRELEVLRLVATGASDAEIADQLVISAHTVHRHVANIRNKLGLSSRAAAVAYATRAGLI